MNSQQQLHRSYSTKYRTPPSIDTNNSTSLPETFVSSLRQLFAILDQTNSGHVSFDLFKRYFDSSSSTIDFSNELEIEAKSNNNLITFDLLINVIKRAISFSKTPSILVPKAMRPLHRSASVFVIPEKTKKRERQIPVAYRSANTLEMNAFNASNPLYYNRSNRIDFPMIRALKRFEIERDLLIQTCNTLDRVKFYLYDRLVQMKEKQKPYCRYLSTAESSGLPIKSMYNRDLVADLLKLSNTVIEEANYDLKVKVCSKVSDHSSSSISPSSLTGLNNQLKAKDDYIKRLETEKRILLKELVEMRHEQGTVIPIKISSS